MDWSSLQTSGPLVLSLCDGNLPRPDFHATQTRIQAEPVHDHLERGMDTKYFIIYHIRFAHQVVGLSYLN